MNLSLIFHPLDFSAGAKPALARALALAKWHDADLHVLHVRSRRRGIDGEEAAHARLRKFVEARNPEGAKFETVILAGDPVTAVADCAGPCVTDEPDRRSRIIVTAARDRGPGTGDHGPGPGSCLPGRWSLVPDPWLAPTMKTIRNVLLRVQGEYRDLPGLKLTEAWPPLVVP